MSSSLTKYQSVWNHKRTMCDKRLVSLAVHAIQEFSFPLHVKISSKDPLIILTQIYMAKHYMMIRWLCWFSCERSLDSARCSTFYLSYLMIRPPVTFSSMSHRVMKIPLTPFSWLDAPDTGYWYKTSSCRHRQQRRLALKQTLLLKSRTLHRGENKLWLVFQ